MLSYRDGAIARGGGGPRLLAIALLWLLAVGVAMAQQSEKCLLCHSRALSMRVDGKVISLKVDKSAFAQSVHGKLACTVCHQDLKGSGIPHKKSVEPVQCGRCHAGVQKVYDASLHGRALAAGDPTAPRCSDCHGKHDIRSPKEADSPTAVVNVPALCGRCHREGSPVSRSHAIPQTHILSNYSMSIHGEGLFRQGLTVTAVCTSCHTAHNVRSHTDPESTINAANIVATCTQCHAQIAQVHRKVIEGRLWQEEPHKIPVCVDCHAPHKVRHVLYPAGSANADCLSCHGDRTLTATAQRDGKPVSLYVDLQRYNRSAHADVACAQCHTEVTPSKVRACATIKSKVDCGICHAEQVQRYQASIHGRLEAKGDHDAPTCGTCHGSHYILSKKLPESPIFPRNQPKLCGQCHRAGERAALRIASERGDVVRLYEDSIHGKGLVESGLLVAATCVDCHGSHDELPPSDPESTVNPRHIADTCGHCHDGIEQTFRTSIHWPGNGQAPAADLPTCKDCHSSHTISRTDKPGFRTRVMDQCGHCHKKEAETYFDTFHGKVSRLGADAVAKCSDCHGTHNILPPHDPGSTLSRDHVVQTCGKCHPGSHRQFAGYLTHATHHDPKEYPWLFWSFWGMTILLIGTLAVALLHALAWLVRLWLDREQWRAHKALIAAHGERVYCRFDPLLRLQHLFLLLSFFDLALTGMALKFSYMGWAQAVSRALGGFEAMGILHRMGAITLIVVFLVHLWDVRRRKQQSGNTWWQQITGPNSILFNGRDLPELMASLKWFFGQGPRPRYGRYTYWEKFDYFAVFWGVMVIGSTGLVLWFPELFTRLLPGWSVNVATIIHSDEALLAVGFIFTIHFFNGHFRPDKFPLDPVIFTGRISLEELRVDRPEEYEILTERGELGEKMMKPPSTMLDRVSRTFGFTFLGIGLTLIALIIYTMLFGYR